MRINKILIIVSAIFLLLIVGCSNDGKYPKAIPKVSVVVNDENYDTMVGEGNWIDPQKGGNSRIGFVYETLTNETKFIEVKNNDTLSFDVSYKKGIKEVSIDKVEFKEIISTKTNSPEIDYKYVDVSKNEYTLEVPKESGEYYYSFNVKWDEDHNLSYLFKIKVD